MESKNNQKFSFIDSHSIIFFFILLLIISFLAAFFFNLGGIGIVISTVYLIGFIMKFNYVIMFNDSQFLVVKHFFIIKRLNYENVNSITCENTGMGRGKGVQIYVYYKEAAEIKKTSLLYFKMVGYKGLKLFLNKIKYKIYLDVDSFKILGIELQNNEFI